MEISCYSRSQKHRVIYKWEIDEIIPFIEFTEDDEETTMLISSNFTTNGRTKNSWNLQLSRNENIKGEGKNQINHKEWMSLYLHLNNGKGKVRASSSIFLSDKKNERKFITTFYKTYESTGGWGIEKFLYIKQLLANKDDFLPNNTLTVGIELTVYEDYQTFPTKLLLESPQRKVTDDLKELYDSKVNSDVIFIVGDEKFKAHKIILSARSPVFFAMFTHDMKEKRDNEVAIPDIKPEIFNKMLKFIYTDEIDNLNADAAYLLEAADKYQLLNLKSLCEESLSKSASIDNAIKLMILADLHNANQLLEFIFEFMIKNIEDVIETPEYKVLEETKPLLFSKLIKILFTSIKINAPTDKK
ncbi:speckle-type POZ protein B-like [Microplitis mediator]|uniref:speckle-type POZ protein B-like n=1 Tax=Microplitis mediator TaxID=375433 RepID=UPI002556A491|nr:speckle-type POZ protein B-like [Microplitis mediator]